MGCASSSPVMAGGPGIVGKARNAVGDMIHQGEDALHDAGEAVNGTIGHVKNAVVNAVQGVGQGLNNAVHTATEQTENVVKNTLGNTIEDKTDNANYTHIPLKSPNIDEINENMEEFKENLMKKTENIIDDTDKLTDELMKETNDVVDDINSNLKMEAEKNEKNDKNDKTETDNNKTPTHSIDSLKTNSPEPEIEKALSNDLSKSPPSPKATLTELNKIEANILPETTTQTTAATHNDFHSKNNNENKGKLSNDVEFLFNIKDLDEYDFDYGKTVINTEPTHWEKLADAILAKPIVRYESNNNGSFVSNCNLPIIENEILE